MDTSTDLDAVLENINLLIEDMEDNINHVNKTKFKSKIVDEGTYVALRNGGSKDDLSGIPIIHHDYVNKSSCSSLDQAGKTNSSDKTSDENSNQLDLRAAKETFEHVNNNKNSTHFTKGYLNRVGGKRLCCSAENSPVLNRSSMVNKQTHKPPHRKRIDSITPRLEIQNMDKYDVAVECPGSDIFKADVFKAWTAFQLAWKIAHVRGMKEKLALVIEEVISDLHLVRLIEDHEIVYKVISNWAPDSCNTLEISERITKYDVFNEPEDYLPIEMFDVEYTAKDLQQKSRKSSFLRSIMGAVKTPDLKGWVFVKDFDKKRWKKRFLRIKNATVYLSDAEQGEMTTVYSCEKCYLYRCLPKFNDAHKTPTQFCFCFIPDVVSAWHEIKCICTNSQRSLTGWISGFRFAKYGEQLYTNFREAMTKEASLRRTNSARQSVLFRRSLGENVGTVSNKATIDFSGSNGRVVSDPLEMVRVQNEMAFEIPKPIKRRSVGANTTSTTSSSAASVVVHDDLLKNVWYHGKLDRERAIMKLKNNGAKDGLFMVRESSSAHGSFVMTVVTKKGKIAHFQINQGVTHSGSILYGMERGPQFSSLEKLIAAYHQSDFVEGSDFVLKKPCPQN